MQKIVLLLLSGLIMLLSAQTDGTAQIKFKTVSYGGPYASDGHCLAAWITDNANVFVRSLEVRAKFPNYGRYLTKWVASSAYNKTDAISGASSTVHTAHSLSWNLKNYSGAVVPDGTYKIWLEFTESNGSGPNYSFTFVKGAAAQTVSPADQPYFKTMSVDYTPLTGIVSSDKNFDLKLGNYPNPFNNSSVINFDLQQSGQISLEIYDIKGCLVKTLIKGVVEQGAHTALWEGTDDHGNSVTSGTYYFILKSNNQSSVKKALLLK